MQTIIIITINQINERSEGAVFQILIANPTLGCLLHSRYQNLRAHELSYGFYSSQ